MHHNQIGHFGIEYVQSIFHQFFSSHQISANGHLILTSMVTIKNVPFLKLQCPVLTTESGIPYCAPHPGILEMPLKYPIADLQMVYFQEPLSSGYIWVLVKKKKVHLILPLHVELTFRKGEMKETYGSVVTHVALISSMHHRWMNHVSKKYRLALFPHGGTLPALF